MGDLSGLVFRLNDGEGPDIVRQVFLERGWVEYEEDVQDEWDWNLWWRSSRFRTSDYDNLLPWQRINHYPRTSVITKKDGLARNLKRMRAAYGSNIYNFSPIAFNLPNDYTRFVNEYTKQKEKHRQNGNKGELHWICKPADLSRGRGIFVFKELSELTYDCTAVVQRYISRPLLIGGYKFDLRIYVSVPSFHPLRIYIHEEGLVRFSTDKYNLGTLENLFSHLTNTSINKHSPMYGADKEGIGLGCKWTMSQLRHYFRQENVDDYAIWMKIVNIITLTLITQHSQIPLSHNCYELYGFDILVDGKLKPWLLEVNFSPAMSCDSQVDIHVKKPMLHDLCDMLGFTSTDLKRGGKQHRINMMNKSRTFDTDLFRYGRRNLGRSNKLPRITTKQGVERVDSPYSSDNESAPDFDHAPVMAGCGLPLIQHGMDHHRVKSGPELSSNEPYRSTFGDWREKRPLAPIRTGATRRDRNSRDTHQDFDLALSDPETYNKRLNSRRRRKSSPNTNSASNLEEEHSDAMLSILTYSGYSEENSLSARTPSESISMENISSGEHKLDVHRSSSTEQARRSTEDLRPRKASVPQYVPGNRSRDRLGLHHRKLSFHYKPRVKQDYSSKYGGFHLVFPFNDVTRKCSEATTLDLRTVVSECHQALQLALETRGKKRFTLLWAPLKENNNV